MQSPGVRLANIRYKKTPKGKYQVHKSHASRRGVPFELTFDQWWTLWQDSGKWGKRGSRAGKYMMARRGDKGPYALANVYICEWTVNVADRNRSVAGHHERRSDFTDANSMPYDGVNCPF